MSTPQIPRGFTTASDLRAQISAIAARLPAIEFSERRWGEIDSYGANWMLARRLGLPKPLETYDTINWNHGICDIARIGASPEEWCGALNYNFPDAGKGRRILVENERIAALLHGAGYRHAIAVGLPFIYEEQERDIPRLPCSVLAVGTHSTPWFSLFDGKVNSVDGKSPNLAFPKAVAQLKSKFDMVAGCIGGSDVLLENWINAYEHNGIPWLTGAWLNDRNALRRMQRIFRSFEYVATNAQGSHIFYALYCGCKVFWFGDESDVSRAQVLELDRRGTLSERSALANEVHAADTNFRKLYPSLFCAPEEARTNESLGAAVIGEPHRREPEEIAAFLGWKLKRARGAGWEPVNPHEMWTHDELLAQFKEAMDAGNIPVMRELLNLFVARGRVPKNAFLALARLLEAHGDKAGAQVAAASEIRYYPDNSAALRQGEAGAAHAERTEKALRVLFVVHGPNQVNGPNIWLTRLLPALKERGIEPRVLMIMTHQDRCEIAERLRNAGVACDQLPFAYTEDLVRAFISYVDKHACDVFVPHLDVAAYFAADIIKAAGIPTVGVLHSDDVFHAELVDEFINGKKGRYLSAAVGVSRYQFEQLRACDHGSTRIVKSPCGAPVPASTTTYSRTPFRFVYVGRLVEEAKRVSATVAAMIALLERRPEVEFVICGDGPERGAIEGLVRKSKVGGRIALRGSLKPAEVQEVLSQSQALVLLSDYEGVPIALMEAMACGVVPICTRMRSGIGDVIQEGKNGFVVEDRGSDFLRAAETLIDDASLWARCSKAARATIEAGFSTTANADTWAQLLWQLQGDAGPRRACELHTEPVLPRVRTNPKGIAREDRRRPITTSVMSTSQAHHPFTNPPLEPNNADLYWGRSSILRAVQEAVPLLHGTFLDIGCGMMPYREIITRAPSRVTRYIGMDIETPIYKAAVDLRWDGRRIPLEDASVDSAMATEVLEHCPEPLVVLREARRVLKAGGVFFFTVPYIWPLHDAPYDFFRYTPFALEKLLREAGFEDVKIEALGGWNASLAQMIGLWLKRAPMAADVRTKMARQLWPFYQELIATDERPVDPKAGNTMATGWSGVARVSQSVAEESPAAATTTASEAIAGDLPIVLVRSHEFNYSETFIEDHVNGLTKNLTLLYGYPFPRFIKGGRSVLPDALETKLKTALTTGGAISPELWQEYARGLAEFLKSCGARAALVETGLMGAFVHEACEQAKLPFVVHFHGLDAFGRELLERWRGHYEKFFRTAAELVVVSKAMREQLCALGAPAEKVTLAPYGVAVDLPAQANPEQAGPRFVAVGRFVEKKAPHLTLQAFAAVHRQVPAARLVMIGDGPLLTVCQEWATKNGLGGSVRFAGVQSRAEVSRQMAAAGIFVQHSVAAATGDSEGLPLAVLEAGAHGLPVVSTRHAGIPDAVREGIDGILVDERDVDAMAAAMLRLAQDASLAAKLGSSLRERVRAEYSRRGSLARLHDILAKAAGGASVNETSTPMDPFTAVSADRNNSAAHLALAHGLIESGELPAAYCAVGEAHRLNGATAETQQLLQALENHGVLDDATVASYRERAGWRTRAKTTQPRRILIATNLLPPQEMGGYGRTMWEFGRELLARGHTVRVLTANLPSLERKPTPEHAAFEPHVRRTLRLVAEWRDGVTVPEPDPVKRSEIVTANYQTILAAAKEFRPDVVIAGNLDFMGHHFVQALLDRGIPVLHRLGNAQPGYEPEHAPRSPLYCIAGCSSWVNDGLRGHGYPDARFAVLPPGSPLTEYYRAFPPSLDKLRIAFAGLLMPYKGAHVLIEALTLLKRVGVDFECTLAGDSTSPDYVAQMRAIAAQHGILDRVRFSGFLAKKELAALYARSNVLVFPSVFEEPFGKTQIEAMAAGLVVISSGTGGSKEIVRDGETGLIFASGNAGSLAEKLAFVHCNPETAAKLAAAGQEDAFRFTTAASVDRLEAMLQELVADAARSARKPELASV